MGNFDNIKLNINGKEFVLDLSKINDKVYRSNFSDNQKALEIFDYFNYYDTDENSYLSRADKKSENQSIFEKTQEDEIRSIYDSLQEAAGDDGCLDETEANNFLQSIVNLQGLDAEDLFDFVSILMNSGKKEPITAPLAPTNTKKTDAEVRQDVIDTLKQDSEQTFQILESQNLGAISKLYNNFKEFFNLGISNAKVYEAAINEAQASKYLALVQEGKLTRSEYITSSRNRLKDMMKARLYKKDDDGKDYISKYCEKYHLIPKEFEKLMLSSIDREYDFLSIDSVKSLMRRLSQSTDSGDKYFLDTIKDKAIMSSSSLSGGNKTGDISRGMKSIQLDAYTPDEGKPLTFEEVFEYEHGVPYNKEACEEYKNDYNAMVRQIGAYNKLMSFYEAKNGIKTNDDAETALNKMINVFQSYYQVDDMPELALNKLKEHVKKNNLPINVTMREGKMSIGVEIGSEDLMRGYVDTILDSLQEELETILESYMGKSPDKAMEEQSIKVRNSHDRAYGSDFSSTLAEKLKNDNNSIIKVGTGYLKEGGMYCASVGGVLCMTPINPVGSAMTVVGGAAMTAGVVIDGVLSAIEANTRAVQSDEEKENVVKDIITDASGMIVGYFASKVGFRAFNSIIDKKLATVLRTEINSGNKAAALKTVFKSPTTLKNFMGAAGAKISTDALLSFTGDLIMMGVLDTNQDWESILKANLMGAVIGTTADMSSFAKTTNQSQAAKAKFNKVTQTVKRKIDDAKTKASDYIDDVKEKASDYIDDIKSAVVTGFNENKVSIITKLHLENANPNVQKIIKKLCDYDFSYSQLEQIADRLQSDIEYTTKEAQRLRRGDGIKKPELEKEFKNLPDFLTRFVDDPSFPLTELMKRRGELTDLVNKVLADPEFPISELPLLLDLQIDRKTCLGWDAEIDIIKNDKKSNLFKGEPPIITKEKMLNDISYEYYSKENLDLIRQLANDTSTDAGVLFKIYSSIELATVGAQLPKIGGIVDRTKSVQDLSNALKDLDDVNIPDKYKPYTTKLRQQITAQLKNYLENSLKRLDSMDNNATTLYEKILNEYEGKIDLPISRQEIENLRRLMKESQRYDQTSALSLRKKVEAISQEIDAINDKIANYLINKVDLYVEKMLNFGIQNDFVNLKIDGPHMEKLREKLSNVKSKIILNTMTKQDFSYHLLNDNILKDLLKNELDKIPNFDLKAEYDEFCKKYQNKDTGSPIDNKELKSRENDGYPYFHNYIIEKYKLNVSTEVESYIRSAENYYELHRIGLRKFAKNSDPEFEYALQQFKSLNINIEDRIALYKTLAKYINGKDYNFVGNLNALEILYNKEDYYTPAEMQAYNQRIEAAQKEYESAGSTAVNNLKNAIRKIIDTLQ